MLKILVNALKNKYILSFLIFIVWVGFIDRNNLVKTIKIRNDLRSMKTDKAYYLQTIEKTKQIKEDLLTNKSSLEKFARENYFLKKHDEEIFIIEFED